MPTLDDAKPSTTAPGDWRRTVLLAVLALATLQLLACQLDAAAPARQGSGPGVPAVRAATAAAAFTGPLVRLAGGHNLQLHFDYPAVVDAATGMRATGIYYGLNYALYPRRAIVGNGRQIVNDDATLRAVDAVPPAAVLRANGVAAVVSLTVGPKGIDPASTGTRGVDR